MCLSEGREGGREGGGGEGTYRVKKGMLRLKCKAMSALGKGPKRLST